MSFAKFAADDLLSPEAEEERKSKHSNWQKYLAAALGIGGLGLAGYYGATNWNKPDGTGIGDKFDAAAGVKPKALSEGLISRNTNEWGSAPLVGGVAGGLMAQVGPTGHRAVGKTLQGLADVSGGSNKGSPLAESVARFDKQINTSGKKGDDGAGGLGRNVNQAMSPVNDVDKAHPFRQAYELSAGHEMGAKLPVWQSMMRKLKGGQRSDFNHVLNGLDIAGAQAIDGGATTETPSQVVNGKLAPGAKPVTSLDPGTAAKLRASASANKLRASTQQHFNNLEPGEVARQLRGMRGQSGSARSMLGRLAVGSFAGMAGGLVGTAGGL